MLHRIFVFILFSIFTGIFTGQVFAQSAGLPHVPERREVVTRNHDFYGADLAALFDTTLQACRKACFANESCRAYTFNTRSKACFPKSGISEIVAYEGAVSAEIFDTDPQVLARAATRREELEFLQDYDIDKARELAVGIGARHPVDQWSTGAMLDAVRARIERKDYLNAMRWTGALVARLDTPDQWAEYARLALLIKTNKSSERRRYARQAVEAATNAYLRAGTKPVQVNALMHMADALERSGRGRNMLSALRLAEGIQPRADVIAALDRAIAKYGFRIVSHRSDNESASPRICAEFSEEVIKAGLDYTPFVRLPDPALVVQAEERQICIDGVRHGENYSVTFRKGLPAESGEELIKDVELTLYVKDRSPSVAFPGRAYVLPKSADAAVPVETVNLTEVDLLLRRVSERNLMRTLQDKIFGRPLSNYQDKQFASDIAEEIWTGKGEVEMELNRNTRTRLPVGDLIADLPAGIYALTARVPGRDTYEDPGATQWFVVTDLGLSTLKGTDGLHVFVRGLGDAAALEGVQLTLLSRANRVLGETVSDAQGHALFAPGLTRGSAGAAPAMVLARRGETDMAFLSLSDPAFDLSDRGVEGRAPAPPVDVFLSTDRGAYRAGETIHATALARDGVAKAIEGLPLTAILTRPDGVEYARHLSAEDLAGGHVFEMPLAASAPRGSWTLAVKADPGAGALATQTVLVEDFLPERIDFEMTLPEAAIRPGDSPPLQIQARYLFGAPGAGLYADGTISMRAKTQLEAFPGYRFGRHDESIPSRSSYLEGGKTGADGLLTLAATLPKAKVSDRPYEAQLSISMREGSGRPVERRLTRILAPAGAMIGIRPAFEDVVPEGSTAEFSIIALGRDLSLQDMQVKWHINRVSTRYQWYQEGGNWHWEPVTRRQRVARGEGRLESGAPLTVSTPVEWGRYEIVVERVGGDYVAASTDFYAGWYAPADASSTPDTLEVSLDRKGYRAGETAQLRIVPRYAGTALITVMSNRVIDMKTVEVQEGENLISLPVTDEWGAGAYVTAQVIRPMQVAAGQNPARALGLSYAQIAPEEKQLSVTIDSAAVSSPRAPLEVALKVEGLAQGETGYVTLAAVDLGILNMTGFDSPDPSAHYFGQRRLGVEMRDLYGRLIDGMNGAQGRVRSGGDARTQAGLQAPPPSEDLLAFFSGPLEVGADGRVTARFDIPDFNGTVRFMALAWSKTAVGQAERDVILRDPVVMTASLPRFLAPQDQSRLLLEIVHTEGPTGQMALSVQADAGLTLGNALPSTLALGAQEKAVLSLPLTAGDPGDYSLKVTLTTPDGKALHKTLKLGVRANDPPVAQTRRFAIGAGGEFTLDDAVFTGLHPETAQAVVSAGPLAKLDAPGLLSSLDLYPYGCTEQVVSRAMPLLYFNQVAQAIGQGNAQELTGRIEQSIARILTRQSSGGGFGLWRADSGDFWLDAYVADFLSRARAEGFEVPRQAYAMTMDNLRNRINYAADFDKGGEAIAYSLMVLAREGAARMGDLRYYADVKAEAFATPLAKAQLGAALAAYGDQTRADRMFALAVRDIVANNGSEGQLWRADYGTRMRDRAAVITLAVEAGSDVVNTDALLGSLQVNAARMSTQEQAWTLLAARSLLSDPSIANLTLDGTPVSGPFVRRFTPGNTGQVIGNAGRSDTDITLTTIGVPEVAPDAGGYGYAIERAYYDMEGMPVSLESVQTGTRLVAVLTVNPFESGEARLIVNDPLPAGLEIDNPSLLQSGDVTALDWLKPVSARHTEFRSDRFIAAVDWRSDKSFRLAYIVRAVSPGDYHHPAASLEDMYRPQYRAHTSSGRMQVRE